jgi:hypothetical protein
MIGQALFYEGKWRGDDYASYARLHGSQEVDRRCGAMMAHSAYRPTAASFCQG